jgi:hypothetical protein
VNYGGWIFWARTYSLQELVGLGGQEKIKDILVATTAKAQKKELLVSGAM